MPSLLRVGVVAVLCACSPQTQTIAPKQVVAERFSSSMPQSGAAIDSAWWKRLNDGQLMHLLALAETNSPDLRTAAANVLKARAMARQEAASNLPDLSALASHNTSKSDGAARETVKAAGLDAAWEIDLFGRGRSATRAARLSAEAEALAYAGAFTSLSAEVADLYVQYRACKLTEEVYRQSAISQGQTRKATAELTEAGLAPDTDLSLAAATAASAQISLDDQRAECRILAQQLTVVTGSSHALVDQILSQGGGLPAPKHFRVSSLPADSLRQRPDVIEAELRFAAAIAKVQGAKSAFFPSLSLSGSISLSDPQSWAFGPVLNLPLFDGGARRASLTAAEADAAASGEAWRKTVLSGVAEVEGTLTRLEAARKGRANAASALSYYLTWFNAIDAQWKNGSQTLLEREEARRSLQIAEITHIQQSAAELRQWIALYKAIGGGWTVPSKS